MNGLVALGTYFRCDRRVPVNAGDTRTTFLIGVNAFSSIKK